MNSYQNLSGKRHGATGLWALFLVVCTLAFALPTSAATFEAISKTLDTTLESCPNGMIDPGETNTVTFVFKNTSGADLTEVKVKMQSGAPSGTSGAVDFSDGEKTVGSVANNGTFSVIFRFRANGGCGHTLRPQFQINGKQGGNAFAEVTSLAEHAKLDFQLGLTVETNYTFSNTAAITIRDNNTAGTYPSTITPSGVPNVSGITGERVKRVEVTLNNISHEFARDVSVMLQGPGDQKVILMRNAGGNTSGTAPITEANVTFVQSASSFLPVSGQITTASYKPTDFGTGNFTSAEGAATGTDINAAFADRDANTQWKLFVTDNSPGSSGQIAGGWTLKIITTKIVCCGGGETFPVITRGSDPGRSAGIANLTINEDQTNQQVSFNADDIESGGGGLTFTATSSNAALIPDAQLEFNDAGDSDAKTRRLKFKTPTANAFGTSTITVTATDGSGRASSASFTLTVNSVNDAPTFPATVRNQSLNKGARTPELSFRIDDVEDEETGLIVTATAQNSGSSANTTSAIVPNSNIFLSGTSADRKITVIPAQEGSGGTEGESTITISLRDANNATTTASFVVKFEANRDEPTVSPIDAQTMNEDGTKRVGFTVRAAATPATGAQSTADGLTITRSITVAQGSPSDLFSSVTIEGSGTERELVFTGGLHKFGSASVIVTVSDGQKTRSTSAFTITVNEVNDTPSISTISTQTISEDGATAAIPFTIGDVETASLSDFVIGASSGKRITFEVLPAGSSLLPATMTSDDNTPGLRFGGSGADRTIRVKPTPDQFGKVTVKLTINDDNTQTADTRTASSSFVVNVDAVNDAPALLQVKRLTPEPAAANPSDLPTNSTDAPVLVTINEDEPGSTAGTPNRAEIELTGITAGPSGVGANEFDQTVSLAVAHDNAALIQEMIMDPASVQETTTAAVTSKVKYRVRSNQSGTATVTLTATDSAGASTVRKFKIQVNAVNDAPTFNGPGSGGTIANQEVGRSQAVVISTTLTDVETSSSNMIIVTKSSSDQTIVKDENIVYDGSRSKVTIIAEANATIDASTTITLKFRDRGAADNDNTGGTETAQRQFTVTVRDIPVNTAPTITLNRESQTILEDGVATATITLTDAEQVNDVTLSASSSDTVLVPLANVLFGGTGASRTAAFVPAADKSGTATVTITATDGGVTINNQAGQNKLSNSKTFVVTVTAVEDQPTISIVQAGPIFGNEDASNIADTNTESDLVEIRVSDAETPTDQLNVTVTSKVPGTSTDSPVIPPGNITINGTGGTRTVNIRPAANQNGTARLKFKVKDSANQEIETGDFDVVVRVKNDTPNLDTPPARTISEDAGTQTVNLSGINAGGGEAGQTLTITARAVVPGSDPLADSPLIASAGSLTVNPNSISVTDGAASFSSTLTFSAVADAFGDADIRVTVTDNGTSESGGANGTAGGVSSATDAKSVTRTFRVSINSVNDRPGINPIQDVSIQQDTTAGPIAITITDTETPAAELTLSFDSSNTGLIPNNTTDSTLPGLQPTGSGGNRGVIIRPVTGASGISTITATVTDKASGGSSALSSNVTFRVTVVAGQKPIISNIPAQSLNANSFTDLITVTVSDAQTAAGNLTVRGESLNTSVIPNANIQFAPVDASAPGQRKLIVKSEATPGNADIRVTVRDADGNESSTTFTIIVRGEAPTIALGFAQSLTVATNGNTGALSFTVGDKETFPGFLRVTVASSNTTLVPTANISLGGSGSSRTVTVTLAANQGGSATITLTVTDNEGQTTSTTFTVATPVPTNDSPTVSSIANQTTEKDKPTSVITFTVGDTETAAASLNVTASSSNKTLVPDASVFLGGSGANRTVFIQPGTGQEGTTTITIIVTDDGPGTAKSASTSFTLTVVSNSAPTISSIPAQTIQRNASTAAIAFTISDTETTAANLRLSGASSDTAIVPNSGINFGGSGGSRTVTVAPAAGQIGTVSIAITVTDEGGKTASTSFNLTINRPPSVKGDFNDDGMPDLLFQDNDGFLAAWYLNGTTLDFASFLLPSNVGDAAYRIVASGDFDRDGSDDVIFQHTDGTLAAWTLSNGSQLTAELLSPSHPGDRNWRVAGAGDVNKDGKVDLVFQHTDGTLAVWYMDGLRLSSASLLNPAHPGNVAWRVAAVGDINADGNQDLIFQHTDGTVASWLMNGANLTTPTLLDPSNPGSGWRIVGAGQYSKPMLATLSGAAERPTPVTTPGSGSGKLSLVGNQLSFNITYSGLPGAATAAHFHGPASADEATGVIINLAPFNGGAFGSSGSLVGTVTLTADQVTMVKSGRVYVNIHTAANPGGEIRGQLVDDTSKAGKVDLVFQHSNLDIAVWFMDGTKLGSASLFNPRNSGGSWKIVAPR